MNLILSLSSQEIADIHEFVIFNSAPAVIKKLSDQIITYSSKEELQVYLQSLTEARKRISLAISTQGCFSALSASRIVDSEIKKVETALLLK